MSLRTHLTTLEASGLVRLAQVEPELEYLFRHALVQEAAYASLVKADRKQLHLAVGEVLERLYPDRREELAGMLALHFAAAGEKEKAIHYSRQAATRAEAAYAYGEAIQHLLKALDLIEPGQQVETRLALLEELADNYQLLREGAQAISIYQSALKLGADLTNADPMTEVRLHRRIVEAFINMTGGVKYEQLEVMSKTVEASRAFLRAWLKRVEAVSPQPETVRILTTLARDAWQSLYRADWVTAERYAGAAVEMAERLDARSELLAALEVLASAHYGRGRLREHLDVSLRRLTISREPRFSDLRAQVFILNSVSSALVYLGEYGQAAPYLLEAESLSDHIRAVESRVLALGLQSQCWFRLDRWDDMFQIADKRVELEKIYPRERVGATCFEIGLAATAHALRGDFEQARALREQAYTIMSTISGAPENWARNQHY